MGWISNPISRNQVEIYAELMAKHSIKFRMLKTCEPFFMSIVSSSDHWLFLSSNGGVSAGRANSNNSLFPYTTDDKVTDNAESTGSKSIFKISKAKRNFYGSRFLTSTKESMQLSAIYTKTCMVIR